MNADTREGRLTSVFIAYLKEAMLGADCLPAPVKDVISFVRGNKVIRIGVGSEAQSSPWLVALLKKRAALATKMAEVIDRRGKRSLSATCSRKSRLQTALISLQNGLVRSQYLLAAKIQACAGPQFV